MSIANSGLTRIGLAAALLAGVWMVADSLNKNLAKLPVQQATQADQDAPATVVKAIYPVWVEGATRANPPDSAGDVDAAFAGRVAQEEVVERPNYAELVRPTVRVDGISSTGVFIAGKFYAVGSSIEALATAGEAGSTVVPRLVAARDDRVVFDVGGDALVLVPGPGGWQ